MKLQNVKGTKDFLPEEQQVRARIQEVCEKTFQQYGCKPLNTPILNEYGLMASKYGGGAEILKEVYTLSDQGKRELALRYDLTIPFAKVIGVNPEMRFPFKRYEIGKVFRDGPVKKGRLREFVQCDLDIVGVESTAAEAELMAMALDVFERLDLDAEIQYNNRKMLSGILKSLEVRQNQLNDVILSLDKLEKIGVNGVKEELIDRGIESDVIARIVMFLEGQEEKSLEYLANNFANESVDEGVRELKELSRYLKALGVKEKTRFNPFLSRGLDIYTGTVYEMFLTDGSFTSSLGGGGRYDDIIGQFLQNGRKYPAVGISFGLDAIFTALMNKQTQLEPVVDVFMIPMGTVPECLGIARNLRRTGKRVEIELTNRRLKKSLDYANKENIPYVIIIGEDEINKDMIQIKNMNTGEEKAIQMEDLYRFFS